MRSQAHTHPCTHAFTPSLTLSVRSVQEFKSHCAPEESTAAPQLLTMLELRHRLSSLGVAAAKHARKSQLVQQLEAVLAAQAPAERAASGDSGDPESQSSLPSPAAVQPPPALEGAVVLKEQGPMPSDEVRASCWKHHASVKKST